MDEKSNEEKMINYETMSHIRQVSHFLNKIIIELIHRIETHDYTKMEEPEISTFVKYTPKLAKTTYGSEEYKQYLKEMKPALDHHYSSHRHHPEYFENGIDDMNLVDLIEMICDWKAATLRHNDGDILRSIELNKERFKYGDQLEKIFKNTVKVITVEE